MPIEYADQRRGLFMAIESLAGTAAILLDADGNLEHASRQACDLLDCSAEGMLRDRWKTIAGLFALPTTPEPSTPYLSEAHIPLPAGTRVLSLELHALDPRAGGGHFAILKDRGVLDHLERELLLASERRGWGHQGATLMHDLKGILNSMQISLELLSSADADTSEISPDELRKQRRIATLKQDLKRMNLALRALPGVADSDEPAAAEFDVGDLLKEIFASLRQLVRRNNVELKLDPAPSPLTVRARRPWIKQALFNVAAHRLNAMRAGGRLAVEAVMAEDGIVVKLFNDAPDMRDGLLDESRRLFSAGRDGEGATDLQVARAILESQGGAMHITSGDAGGTLFSLRLPG